MTRRARIAVSLLLVAAAGAAVPALARLTQRAAESDPVLVVVPATGTFTLSGMVPGDSITRCVVVGNVGGGPMQLIDYPTVTGELAEHLLVTVEQGTGVGPEAPSCARFSRRGTSPYVYNTQAGGVRVGSLRPEVDPAFDAGTTKSLRVTVALPSATTIAGAAKEASFALNFRGDAEAATATTPTTTPTTTTPDLPGGIAPGTTGGFDKNGTFLTNAQIKKKLRIGRARLLKNGDVVVAMFLPAGGAIRAKVILPNGVYYGHTLLPEEWGPKVRVLLKRRPVGRDAVLRARRLHRPLVTRVTTRYRWAHGDDAYVEPSQKLTIVR